MQLHLPPHQAAELGAAIAAALAAYHCGEPWEFEFELPKSAVRDAGPRLVHDDIEMLPGNRFSYHGRTYQLPIDQWNLLNEIVHGGGEFCAIAKRVWGNPGISTTKVYRLVRSLRERFRTLRVPLVARSKQERAYLTDC